MALPYSIHLIPNSAATELFVRYHYLHRKAPCTRAFGLFDGPYLIGAIAYGSPASPPLCRGICGPEHENNIYELTRLWIKDDSLPNAESFLIGNTLRLLDKEIIVSFAEPNAGHIGTIYQATNWIYTGLSAKRTDWNIKGDNRHCKTISDGHTAKEMREKFGDDFSLKDRPRKHRYIFFNCGPRRKKYLLSQLRYPIMPYPKH